MSITLNLSPDVEKGLMAQARERGIPLSDYPPSENAYDNTSSAGAYPNAAARSR
jgi:hypothetical protein